MAYSGTDLLFILCAQVNFIIVLQGHKLLNKHLMSSRKVAKLSTSMQSVAGVYIYS
jgi:hypothetical protein